MRYVAIATVGSTVVLSAVTAGHLLAQGVTTRVSVDSSGSQAFGGDSHRPSISADNRFIAFQSGADNLVDGDTNDQTDVFVRDRLLGTTLRVSVDSSGAQALGGASLHPVLSADGSVVVFGSDAVNLVAGDTNGFSDVFVHELGSGVTARVNVSSAGVEAAGGHSQWPAVSSDGRFVAFYSRGNNLVANDLNGSSDIFLRDRATNVTSLVSQDSAGVQQNGECGFPAISADARFVAFVCNGDNLVAGDNNGEWDVFVRDRLLATTVRASVDSSGLEGTASSTYPSISADGRFVAFSSGAGNLVFGDTNNVSDIFVHDIWNGSTTRVSVGSGGVQSVLGCTNCALSADGRYVSFRSASHLASGDTNTTADIYLHDCSSGVTELVSVSTGGTPGNASCNFSSVSTDGRYVVLDSFADTLAPGDTNGTQDVFLRDRGALTPHPYCTSSTTSNGCSPGIGGDANPSVSHANACNLTVANVEGQKSGLLFYGVDNAGFTPLIWGRNSASWLCVKPPTQRTPIQDSGGTSGVCDGSYVLDWNAYQSANPLALGNPWSIGAKAFVQAWFRDPLAVKSTNLSNALEMTYVP